MYHNPNPPNPILEPFVLLRLVQILGDKKRGIQPIIPVSKSTWWLGIATGRYPKPVRVSAKAVAWRASDIAALVTSLYREAA